MPRTKKTPEDQQTNLYIGRKVAQFREDARFSLVELAQRLNISPAHLKSLEGGRYNFNATLLAHLARELNRPVEAFFRDRHYQPDESERNMWIDMYDSLPSRERNALFDVGKRLLDWSDDKVIEFWRRLTSGRGFLVSLEGIDGVLMAQVTDRLLKRLNRDRSCPYRAVHCWYQHGNTIWTFMFERFVELKQGGPGRDYSRAFERTLLFACERLQRQENQIKPALERGDLVITPFFYLAPRVYQRLEGVKDPTIVQAVANFLIVPDLIIVIESDPVLAAERATLRRPGENQFFSPYDYPEEFQRALQAHHELYLDQNNEPSNRAIRPRSVQARPERPLEEVVDEVTALVMEAVVARNGRYGTTPPNVSSLVGDETEAD